VNRLPWSDFHSRKHRTVTIRIPGGWRGQVDSERVAAWLELFLSSPLHLPADPGPGDAILRLSIPVEQFRCFMRKMRCSNSRALRRLLAANLRPVQRSSLEGPSLRRTDLPDEARKANSFCPEQTHSRPRKHPGGLVWDEGLAVSPLAQHALFRGKRGRV